MCIDLKNMPPYTPPSRRLVWVATATAVVFAVDMLAIALIGLSHWLSQ